MSKVDEKSTVNRSDCKILLRQMQVLELNIYNYAADGFREQGFCDDFILKVSAWELKNTLDKILTKTKLYQ